MHVSLCCVFHWFVLVCASLQEVNATPVRFISDLLVEDSWSHVFMDTLAPRGFVKVREDRGREREIVLCGLVYIEVTHLDPVYLCVPKQLV